VEQKEENELSEAPAAQLTYAVVNSTTFKHATTKEVSQKFKLGNTILNYEVGYKPADFNNDEKALQLKHVAKYDTASTKLENTETLKVGFPQVGPLRPWLTFDVVWNTLNADKLVKNSLNLQLKDYNLAYKVEHNTKKFKSALGLLALKNAKGDFFVRGDFLKQHVTLGCGHGHGPKSSHSVEVTYDHSNETKGVYGYPVTAGFAGVYGISDDIVLKTKLCFKDEVKLGFSWVHQFNKNLKFVYADELNVTNAVKNPSETNYNFGVLFEFKI
jgi:hypothetical protein